MKNLRAMPVLVTAAAALVVLPALLFMGSALYRGMGFGNGFAALVEQFGAAKTNLGVITLLGFAPLLLVVVLLGIRRVVRKTWDGAGVYALFSSLPVIFVAIFVHLEYWPSWLPNRQPLGFPHGLEFIIGPLLFAPVGVILGFIAGWLIWRRA